MSATIILMPVLGGIFGSSGPSSAIETVVQWGVVAISLLTGLASMGCGIFVIHYLLTLPMRRAERARLFLDLLEGALNRGQSAEAMIVSVAQSHDRMLGARFHLLAAHIEGGLRLGAALEKVPRFLPPPIAAMLLAGERLGDLRRVLPACREILRERPEAVRSAVHYMLLVALFISPAALAMVSLTAIFVIPRFREVAASFSAPPWPPALFLFGHVSWVVGSEIVLLLFLVLITALYLGGPRSAGWFSCADRIAWLIPWKRKRLLQTFSAMLAVLLDGGVPEAEAVRLAGECTVNKVSRRRSERVVARLQQGTKLDEAVRDFDDGDEFHWRLANAIHSRGGFLSALRGWHEALNARAFLEEEATAHTVTTGLVIFNGLVVGLITIAMFGLLVGMLKATLAST